MPIGPVTAPPQEINVVEPVSLALEHVKRVLFQPFDLGKWFVIGFCAWLAHLGEGGLVETIILARIAAQITEITFATILSGPGTMPWTTSTGSCRWPPEWW